MSLHEKATKTKKIFPDAKKGQSRMEDNRYAGMTVNKAKQQQRRERIIGNIVANAERNRSFGMEVSPEQQWVLSNRALFL